MGGAKTCLSMCWSKGNGAKNGKQRMQPSATITNYLGYLFYHYFGPTNYYKLMRNILIAKILLPIIFIPLSNLYLLYSQGLSLQQTNQIWCSFKDASVAIGNGVSNYITKPIETWWESKPQPRLDKLLSPTGPVFKESVRWRNGRRARRNKRSYALMVWMAAASGRPSQPLPTCAYSQKPQEPPQRIITPRDAKEMRQTIIQRAKDGVPCDIFPPSDQSFGYSPTTDLRKTSVGRPPPFEHRDMLLTSFIRPDRPSLPELHEALNISDMLPELSAFPTEGPGSDNHQPRMLTFDTDSAVVGIDNRCTACMSYDRSDFVGRAAKDNQCDKGF